jgi:4-diphosphocytidyl-2-C-methyl-D-erythritol kinase
LIVFPNCKINLGLHVLGKRSDGFHNLETVFYPVKIYNIVEAVQSEKFQFSSSGIVIPGNDNICVKAYELLKKNIPSLPAVKLHLHKIIPPGSGLGGGSADGAFTLKLLDKKFDLRLTTGDLMRYALQLGSDCPFFLLNQPCVASGRGEELEITAIDLAAYKLFIVNPGIHIATKWAFSKLKLKKHQTSIKDIIKLPVENWKEKLINVFEEPVFEEYPGIKKIKDQLYNSGAVYASLSGSGSTVYGIFKKDNAIDLSFPANYFTRQLDC